MPRLPHRFSVVCLLAALLLPGAGRLLAAEPVEFAREIQPLLASRCYDCHGPEQAKGGLRLTSLRAALKGGESGEPALIAGQGAKSLLLHRVVTTDDEDVMPQKGERLTAAEVTLLQRWIDEGAPWPENLQHWAYVKPVRAALPAVAASLQPLNPIDHFVFARLAAEGLAPSPATDKARWLRRVSLDLVGLPPTPAELADFAADATPRAFERVVDRLLASPHYGERWARPWLDLARYADSHGFQRDDLRDLWPYRDWVVRAMNADMPFDQFTVWQVAGDLLPEARDKRNLDPLIATGFHRAAPTNVEAGTDQEEGRVNQVFDRVNTTAATWLGTTLECAQCHNHKYDPFTQKEYYQLFAFFNQTAIETAFASPKAMATLKFTGPYLTLPNPAVEAKRPALLERAAALDAQIATQTAAALSQLPAWEKIAATETVGAESVPAEIAAIVRVDAARRTKAQIARLRAHVLEQEPALVQTKRDRAEVTRALAALESPRTLVMEEMSAQRPTALLKRGNFLEPGEAVAPSTPAVLHAAALPATPNRLDLAQWLVDRENPLVARVTVNRWWAEFFGRGIVATPEDFGVKGEAPTHPALLDWLAVEFMERGWSMKHIHKLITLSATYRQSSRVTPALLARDDQNRLLARGPRFRLDAEAIRDNALAAAGLLSAKMGGPPVRPYQPPGLWDSKVGGDKVTYDLSEGEDAHRRGLYTVWKRGSPYPSFVNFDATARTACTVKRSRSNTPLQALTLLNDPVYVEAAQALARRVLQERPDAAPVERIRFVFQLCLTRPPSPGEIAALQTLIAQQTAAGRDEAAVWQAVATTLLNLDEMITKG
ncbi:PSD1 and planctomycete cytochrome C domain-containing protein [Horticoccus sp. 23ND18S-11]|uniref:PSD1 and planctomycete cytochrome C domain-containing protein n=1 Tax=Horticoccus sp. 23ND18S-11 TaxID=3391832 RepID=UPI0039C8E55A